MLLYYVGCLHILLLKFLRVRDGIIIFLGVVFVGIVLYILPSTGLDYDFYKIGFEDLYQTASFPYLHNGGVLFTEIGWTYYSAIFRIFTDDFRVFLVLNWLVCLCLFQRLVLQKVDVIKSDVFVFALLVVVPVLFYWSPRSSVSFVLASGALFSSGRRSFALALVAISIHTQFLPLLAIWFLSKYGIRSTPLIILFGYFIFYFLGTHIAAKVGYLAAGGTGFRTSSILSFIYLPIYVILRKKISRSLNLTLLFSASVGIVVLFRDNAHIAGRLVRLTDYLGFVLVLPIFMGKFSIEIRNVLMLLSFILIVYVFPEIYNFN